LANDGRTIFMATRPTATRSTATRSTGQIEEGPVGLSLAAIDGGVVSWRFKLLDEDWPLVMITSPADHRLIIDPKSPDQVVRGPLRIAAKVWGRPEPARVSASIDEGPGFPLTRDRRSPALWCAVSNGTLLDGPHQLTVRAENKAEAVNSETITFLFSNDGSYRRPQRIADGSDRDSIGAWPDKHLLGTQLGPDRNGRKW
jgi:Icc protein